MQEAIGLGNERLEPD